MANNNVMNPSVHVIRVSQRSHYLK